MLWSDWFWSRELDQRTFSYEDLRKFSPLVSVMERLRWMITDYLSSLTFSYGYACVLKIWWHAVPKHKVGDCFVYGFGVIYLTLTSPLFHTSDFEDPGRDSFPSSGVWVRGEVNNNKVSASCYSYPPDSQSVPNHEHSDSPTTGSSTRKQDQTHIFLAFEHLLVWHYFP